MNARAPWPSSSPTRRCSTRRRSCTPASRRRSRRLRAGLGASHALHVDGADVRAAHSYEKRSPADARRRARALPARRRRRRGPRDARGPARLRHAGASPRSPSGCGSRGASPALLEERVYEIAAALALEVGKNRMEALGEAQETADFFAGYAAELERNAGYDQRPARRPAPGLPLAKQERAEALRRLGRDHALQLPAGARRRAGGGGARHRQHRGAEGRDRHAVGGAPARRLHPRRGLPAGRLQLRDRPRQRRGRGARRPRAPRRAHLHGLVRRGHGAAAEDDGRRLAPPLHRRDGRQERLRRDRARRTWSARPSGIVRSAFGLSGQKCSALSRLYVEDERRRRAPRAARGARAGDPDRRPVPARELDGAGDQRGGRGELRALLRAARGGRRPHPRGRAPAPRGRARPRPLRGADARRGAARTIRSSGRRCSSRS